MNTKLDRRRFLVGSAGVAVALPYLESLNRGAAKAQEAERPRFVGVVRAGNGVAQQNGNEPEQFWPRTVGALTTDVLRNENSDRAVSELASFASRLNVVKGVRRPFNTPTCGHSDSIVQVLTAANITPGAGNAARALGESIDWRIARSKNPDRRDPLTFMAGPASGYITEGLSWSASGVKNPAERSPLNAYMRMTGLASAPVETQQRIVARRTSVNDLVRGQMQRLLGRSELSSSDRSRLQTHFEAIRDTEIQLTCDIDPDFGASLAAIGNPQANDVRPEVVRQFMAVAAFAFSCDINRVFTLQVGEGNDQTQYEIDGSRLPRFHWISHRINSDGSEGEPIPNAPTLHHKIDRLQLQMFRYLLERLDSYPSAFGGTLLDDSVMAWTNDLSSGPPHGGTNVPWLLAGGAGGSLRTGNFVDVQGRANNIVLNTILSAAGVRKDDGSIVDDFGDASLTRGVIDSIVTV